MKAYRIVDRSNSQLARLSDSELTVFSAVDGSLTMNQANL